MFRARLLSLTLLAVTAALPLSSHGASLILDFGNHVDADGTALNDLSSPAVNPDSGGYPDFNNDGTYTMYFQDVANDGTTSIDATLVAERAWHGTGDDRVEETGDLLWAAGKSTDDGTWSNNLQWPHGNLDGDIRVNAGSCYRSNMDNNTSCGSTIASQTIQFTLYLWEDGGSNALDYLTDYDPGVDFDWTLAFYDIDSNNPDSCSGCADGSSWDEVTLLTPGTYAVTATTDLAITDLGAGVVNFSGAGVGSIPGQDGLESPITQDQADIMVLYTMMNRNSVTFEYTVGYTAGTPMTVRNFLMDGGSLALAECTNDEGQTTLDCGFESTPIPEPAPLALISVGLAALGFARRRAKVNRAGERVNGK